jgi:hypothetical protein
MEDRNAENKQSDAHTGRSRLFRGLQITALILLVIILAAALWIKHTLYASKFTPTKLSSEEQVVLETKLAMLEDSAQKTAVKPYKKEKKTAGPLEPEPYTEEGVSRGFSLSEKELNSLIANQPEVAERVAIDLSDDLVSVKLVVPVDEDFPIMGGKTLRFHMGLTMSYEEDRPVIAISGISLGGIPVPNAWMGYMKNRNLVDEFGTEGGFWHIFSEGIEDIRVKEGRIRIILKE